jgi:hypothetical protein
MGAWNSSQPNETLKERGQTQDEAEGLQIRNAPLIPIIKQLLAERIAAGLNRHQSGDAVVCQSQWYFASMITALNSSAVHTWPVSSVILATAGRLLQDFPK